MSRPESPFSAGLRTAIYAVPDLARAKAWYQELFGIAPYFDQPFYVGFNVGGFELGLMPEEGASKSGRGGVTAYWGVANADAAWKRLLEMGAQEVSPVQDVGEGIRTAVASDPFGNSVGIIENPHFSSPA